MSFQLLLNLNATFHLKRHSPILDTVFVVWNLFSDEREVKQAENKHEKL